MRGRIAVLLAAFACLTPVAVSDQPAKSGLKAGDEMPGPFRPFNVTGPRQNKLHCPVCEHGLNPTALIFVPMPEGEPSKPLVALMQGLEKQIDKYRRARFGAAIVFLNPSLNKPNLPEGDLLDTLAVKVRDWAKAAGLREDPKGNQVVLAIDHYARPKGYALKEGWTTALIYDKLHVVNNLSFEKELTDADVQSILGAVDAMLGKKK
jgi:hypothetical protein